MIRQHRLRGLAGMMAVLLAAVLCGCQTDSGGASGDSASAAPSQQKTAGDARVIEVIATDFDGMVREGENLAALHPNIVVKVPMTRDGVKALKYFTGKGIKTNCTLVFSAGQALLAAKAGATYVSPFVGRLDDVSTDGVQLIEQIRTIYDNYGFGTEILAASIRHPMHIIQCAEVGADVATCPLSAITALFDHPLTTIGLEKFLADHKKAAAQPVKA